MKPGWTLAFGVIGGLLAAGLLLLVARQPNGEPVELLPPPTLAPLIVHITGAVANPGVYTLAPSARVGDLIAVAGGLLPEADGSRANLAAPLEDGTQICIPFLILAVDGELATVDDMGLTNLNTATQTDLEKLPHIGPVLAQEILNYRAEHGQFVDVEELLNVPGIGPVTLDRLRDLVTVGD
jgi:competence protein ComEA